MKRYQTGEVMLVMMIAMMTVVLLSRGHMGMMGHGSDHTAPAAGTAPQNPADPAPKPAPGESAEAHR